MATNDNDDWTPPRRAVNDGKAIITPEPERADSMNPWDNSNTRFRPDEFQVINRPKGSSWLSPRNRMGQSDFNPSTNAASLFEKFSLLPILTGAFIIADVILLGYFIQYIFS